MSPTPEVRANPYVGPRAFRFGETLYGRDHEALELLQLLIAERIVLLYSPSGAGKTSLIQAAVMPELEKREGFTVPSVARVSLAPPPVPETANANRYVLSVLLSLEGSFVEAEQLPIAELARMELGDYFERRPAMADAPDGVAFIFDQFEEILTLDPTDTASKEAFFGQVAAALRSPNRWALFAMREEHVAGLDPYRRPLPTRLNNTYRLELLKEEQARQAMQKPAKAAGVDFTDGAAQKLVDDLRRVRVQRPEGMPIEQLGPFVEPVQLQVTCQSLWSRLAADDLEIGEDDVAAHGDVDKTLADYYSEQVARVAGGTGARERIVRRWIEDQLITPQGLRNQILQEDTKQARGLDIPTISALVDTHLVRAERRRGITWFELAHDRLIEPIRKDNAIWREANLSILQRQATLWHEQGRPQQLELRNAALAEAERWAAGRQEDLTQIDRDFLGACLETRARESRERRRTRGIRFLGAVTLISLLLFAYLVYSAWSQKQPWAYLSDVLDGQLHELKGESVKIGRSAGGIPNDIEVKPETVSRLQVFISKSLVALDVRSLNGTTVNAEFLRYGYERELQDGDLIALAGVAVFKLTKAVGPSLPFLPRQKPEAMAIPSSAWGVLIDGAKRDARPLVADTYFLSFDGNGGVVLKEDDSAGSLLEIIKYDNGLMTLLDRDDEEHLYVTMKEGDYEYNTYPTPPNQEFPYLEAREEHDLFEVTFCYGKKASNSGEVSCYGGPFQFIPVSVGAPDSG